MIICNGVVGLFRVVGRLHHREPVFRIEGANASLATLIAMSTLALVRLPLLDRHQRAHPHHVATAAQERFKRARVRE